jgi:hypothetical protein
MVSRFKISSISPNEKIFLVPTLFLSPLFPRMSKRLSMGEEVGTMQFRVQGEQIKNERRKRRRKMSIKKRKNRQRKNTYEKRKKYEFIKIK